MLYDALTRRADFLPDGAWTLVYALWVVGSAVFVLHRRQRPSTALAWLLAFWTVPLLAAFGYFLLGPRKLDKQSGLRQKARRRAAEVVPPASERLPPSFLESSPLASLAHVARSLGDRDPEPRRAAAFALYRDGEGAYPAIEAAIDAARETIHLEYYIWQPDGIGTRLRDRLAERAREGIEVRLVVDALGAKNCAGTFWTPLLEAGGEVRKFNPPHPLKPQPGKTNFRTHRKIVVVDGRIAFTGGVNVDDAETAHNGPPWRDTHVRLEGAPATGLQAIFLEDWLYALPVAADGRRKKGPGHLAGEGEGPPLPAGVERWFPEHSEANGPWVQVIDSGPDEASYDIHLLLFTAIASARERVWITTPYLVPDEPILTALASAAARGVDVRVLLPAEGDSRLVEAAAATYTHEIAGRGARVYRYLPVMNHSKSMVVDDAFSVVGTANLDNRSFRLNFELVLAVFDEGVTAELARMFEEDLAESRPFDPDDESPGFVQRLTENAARLLSPLL